MSWSVVLVVFSAPWLMAGCDEGSREQGRDQTLEVNRSCEGQAIGLDGECTAIDPDAEVFRVSESDLTMDGSSDTPGTGAPAEAGDGMAEACCIFAVANLPGLPTFVDNYGQAYFMGGCQLPFPWTPGAFGVHLRGIQRSCIRIFQSVQSLFATVFFRRLRPGAVERLHLHRGVELCVNVPKYTSSSERLVDSFCSEPPPVWLESLFWEAVTVRPPRSHSQWMWPLRC